MFKRLTYLLYAVIFFYGNKRLCYRSLDITMMTRTVPSAPISRQC
jgi:hypothetical protein